MALERLTYDRAAKAVTYRSDKSEGPTAGTETVDPLEFLARVLVHIPDQGRGTTRHDGWYANRPRGMRRQSVLDQILLRSTGVPFTEPQGAYDMMVDVTALGFANDTLASEWLINDIHVHHHRLPRTAGHWHHDGCDTPADDGPAKLIRLCRVQRLTGQRGQSRNARAAAEVRTGSSSCGTWPSSGKRSIRLPRMSRAKRSA